MSVQLTKIDSFNLPLDCKLPAIPTVRNGYLASLTHFKEAADNDEKKTLDLSAHESIPEESSVTAGCAEELTNLLLELREQYDTLSRAGNRLRVKLELLELE